MTTIRLTDAVATLAVLLGLIANAGCVSTGKLSAPQWLSFNRERGTESSDAGLPDPSTLAVPTTVTQPSASAVASTITEPTVTTPPTSAPLTPNVGSTASVTTVPANTYPTTNQPPPTNQPSPYSAPANPAAGFLPSAQGSNVALTTPPATSAPTNQYIQQGPYGAQTNQQAAPASTAMAQTPAQPPMAQTPSAHPQPTTGTVATTTWDQPSAPPTNQVASGSAANSGLASDSESMYGASPIGTTDPAAHQATTSVYGVPSSNTSPDTTAPAYDAPQPPTQVQPASEAPTAQPTYQTPAAGSSTGIAQATYIAPAAPSHYGEITREASAGNAAWRPGSTTNYMPTMTQ